MGPYPPPYPPAYYAPPPRSDGGKIILIIVIVVVVAIAVPIVLGAILYFMVSGLIAPPDSRPPQGMGISLSRPGTNWSAVITSTPGGKLPSSTFLMIADSQGRIVLPLTSFASLTWAGHRAVYRDANPGLAEIGVADGIVMDASTYPAGDTMQISDGQSILVVMPLR